MHTDDTHSNTLFVHSTEAGQKLLQFLVRRLGIATSVLHKWIRTGQVRVQGGRCDAFRRVKEGDAVRVPPFAWNIAKAAGATAKAAGATAKTADTMRSHDDVSSSVCSQSLPLPPCIYEDAHLLVFNKSAGLPVHAGTGHTDSLASRLEQHYAQDIFRPTPIHRLDKDTSGVILVARSYGALRAIQDILKMRTLTKEYLVWVHGIWPHGRQSPSHTHEQPHNDECELTHFIGKKYHGDDEKVRLLREDEGKQAICRVTCLHRQSHGQKGMSLMRVCLISGRTHQIRVQLATEGFPVVGDVKYGAPPSESTLCLHAFRVTLPQEPSIQNLCLHEHSFTASPPWTGHLTAEHILKEVEATQKHVRLYDSNV